MSVQVVLVDEHDNPVGLAEKMVAHEQGLLHRAFSVFVLRQHKNNYQVLMQQRAKEKYHCGGLWTNTCCSHPYENEKINEAAVRRLKEELGFSVPLEKIGAFTYYAQLDNGLIEHELDHVLVGFYTEETAPILCNDQEVMDYEWITLPELREKIHLTPLLYTPWLLQALSFLEEYMASLPPLTPIGSSTPLRTGSHTTQTTQAVELSEESSLRKIRVSAPGSVMLAGEHAVLRGHPALVAAINQRIFVEISSHEKKEILIDSDKFGIFIIPFPFIEQDPPFHFISNVLLPFASSFDKNDNGIKIKIISEFSPTIGLGSSAALCVALLYGLSLWFDQPLDLQSLAIEARECVRRSQNGLGSGADVLASVYGGTLYYIAEPFYFESLSALPPITLLYSGSKTPTPIVIAQVNEQEKNDPTRYNTLFSEIRECTENAKKAITDKNWKLLGFLFNQHATLQSELGVSSPLLENLLSSLRNHPTIFGAKISGSGLGDCIVGIGTLSEKVIEQIIPVEISSQGVQHETI